MSDNYIIEIRPKSVSVTVQAGIVVRDGHRFRFYAATHAFGSLEGRLFKSPKAAESAALRHIVGETMRDGSGTDNNRPEQDSNALPQAELSTTNLQDFQFLHNDRG